MQFAIGWRLVSRSYLHGTATSASSERDEILIGATGSLENKRTDRSNLTLFRQKHPEMGGFFPPFWVLQESLNIVK